MQTTLEREEMTNRLGSNTGFGSYSSEPRFNTSAATRDTDFKRSTPFAAPANDERNANNRVLIAAMVNSKIYQDYEKAFSEATGMPVALRPAGSAETVSETAVPVHLGDRLIGFLQTGDTKKSAANKWGFETQDGQPDEVFFGNKVVSDKQHDPVFKLLGIFAQHLSMLSNQVVVQQKNAEPPAITRAKEYIQANHTEDLSLGQVAKVVNTSTFYFCKMFKKATGINFTDYLSRVRIEKSKNLLLNPNLRVSEIAFEVGFQSLTHFNRVFKKILGQSPTEYRSQLAGN